MCGSRCCGPGDEDDDGIRVVSVPPREVNLVEGDLVIDPEWVPRRCLCLPGRPSDAFPGNAIKSTRYTYLNFVPKNLFEQLAPWNKPANFYFLCIACMQAVSEISTTQGKPTILMPLLFVLIVTMIKDWLEDSKRREQDRAANESMYRVYRNGQWLDVQSQSIRVGDFVLVPEDSRVPCDLFVVASGSDTGDICFVDTKDLDGETNLKPKAVPAFLHNSKARASTGTKYGPVPMNLKIRCDSPLDESFTDMGEWKGMIGLPGIRERQYANADSFILRTCVVRSTPWVVGVAVYTGEDTKIRKNNARNQSSIKYKTSRLFSSINSAFKVMGFLQLLCCLLAALGAGLYQDRLKGTDQPWGDAWYLGLEKSPVTAATLRFFTWFIICKDFLPISLYVSLEMVQFLQALFIGWDARMANKDPQGNWGFAGVQTSRLNEELAQVDYIFSDKTGTLTQNRMDFKKCVVGRKQYGTRTTTAGIVMKCRLRGWDVEKKLKQFRESNKGGDSVPFVDFDERKRMFEDWKLGGNQARVLQEYFYALSVNNTVYPKAQGGSKGKKWTKEDWADPYKNIPLILDSSSPDEKALVHFAQYMGFQIYKRTDKLVRIRRTSFDGKDFAFEDFEDVCLIDFSSKRKRMTVIVSPMFGPEKGLLKIYCKGADSYVKALLRGAKKGASEIDRVQRNAGFTWKHLKGFGGESLRTLVVAVGTKPRSWWFGDEKTRGWKPKYDAALQSGNKAEIDALEEQIEMDAEMDLVGATAIEDKLQEGVPQAIRRLLDADIKIWVLTGDNVATAINIGISCNLLEADMHDEGRLFVFDDFEKSEKDLTQDELKSDLFLRKVAAKKMAMRRELKKLDEKKRELVEDSIFDAIKRDFIMKKKTVFLSKALDDALARISFLKAKYPHRPLGLALHGNVWKVIRHNSDEGKDEDQFDMFESVEHKFYALARECKSVLGCRLEPTEKADIVRLIQRKEDVSTLAIGDGNNDTVMIKTAEIGVGIRGVEGTSAVSASDYVIGQFRFLTRLLLVYGRLNNRRISMLVYYMFYKTSMVVWTVLFFGFYSAFSGQFPYLDWMYQIHNIAFTALPIIVFAVLDRDIPMHVLEKYPFVYPWTRGKVLFGYHVLVEWMATAFLHGCICFFVPWFAFEVTSPEQSGQSFGFQSTMLVVYMSVVIVTNQKLMFYAAHWNWVWHLVLWGSIAVTFGAVCVFSTSTFFAIGGIDYYAVGFRLFVMPRFWMTLLLTVGFACLVDFSRAVVPYFYPDRTRVFIEALHAKKVVFNPDVPEEFRKSREKAKQETKRARSTRAGYTGSNFEHTPNLRKFMTSKVDLKTQTVQDVDVEL